MITGFAYPKMQDTSLHRSERFITWQIIAQKFHAF